MEFIKVCCMLAASLATAKAGHLGGGSSYGVPSAGGGDLSSSYGAPSFGDAGGAISTSYNIPSASYGAPSGGGFAGQSNGGYSGGGGGLGGGGYSNGGGYGGGGGYSNGGGYGGGGHGGSDHSEPAKPYEFGYSVKDPHTGSDFKQQETSDGNTVKGQYKVLLPDGRTQIVTYTADWQTGFHADVKYEGEAIYPSNYGNGGGSGGYGGGSGSGGYGGGSGFGGSSSYGVPSEGGYSGGGYSAGGAGGDFNHGGGVATGTAYNTLGYGGSSNGGGHGGFTGY